MYLFYSQTAEFKNPFSRKQGHENEHEIANNEDDEIFGASLIGASHNGPINYVNFENENEFFYPPYHSRSEPDLVGTDIVPERNDLASRPNRGLRRIFNNEFLVCAGIIFNCCCFLSVLIVWVLLHN